MIFSKLLASSLMLWPVVVNSAPAKGTNDWTKATCAAIGDPGMNPATAWEIAGVNEAWNAAVTSWQQDHPKPGDHKLSFVEGVIHYFNGPRNWNCANIAQGEPCVAGIDHCGDKTHTGSVNAPAGFLIGDSFTNLHNIHSTRFQGIINAKALIDIPSLQKKFAPIATNDVDVLKDILDVLAFVGGISSSFTWNLILKKSPIFSSADAAINAKKQETYNIAKDNFNSAIVFAIATGKDNLPAVASSLNAPNNGLDAQNFLDSKLTSLIAYYTSLEAARLSYLFKGANQDITDLKNLINNGLLLPTPPGGLDDIMNNFVSVLYAVLIPSAWKLNQLNPFILMTNDPCGGPSGRSVEEYMSDNVGDATNWCWDNHKLYLVQGVKNQIVHQSPCIPRNGCEGGLPIPPPVSFTTLPGGDRTTLDSSWGGVRVEDYIISAYEGYKANDYANGYKIPDGGSNLQGGDGSRTDLIFGAGIRTPGLYNLPVCSDITQIIENIVQGKPPC